MTKTEENGAGEILFSPDGLLSARKIPEGLEFQRALAGRSPRQIERIAFAGAWPLLLVIDAYLIISHNLERSSISWIIVALSLPIAVGIGKIAAFIHRSAELVPLRAEPSGRVTHGERILLEQGATRRIYIERKFDEESHQTIVVEASNRWGPVVTMKDTYFGITWSLESAVWFANQLGSVIAADVDSSGVRSE